MVKSSSAQQIILAMLKERFGTLQVYNDNFDKILLICTEIPAVHNDESKEKFKTEIKKLKRLLKGLGVEPKHLDFLDEQIEIYDGVNFLDERKYNNKKVDKSILKTLHYITNDREGVLRITQAYTWEQLKEISKFIFMNDMNRMCFFISQQIILKGMIVAKVFETPQEVELMRVMESFKEDKHTGEKQLMLAFMGEEIQNNKYFERDSLTSKFYVYRFISEYNEEFFLYYDRDIPTGEYSVTGCYTKIKDRKKLTDSTRILTKLPYVFANKVIKRIATYNNKETFLEAITQFNISKETLFEFPFLNPKDLGHNILLNPDWYKWLMWAMLTHSPSGEKGFQKYPAHFMILGETGSGKSSILNNIHANTGEINKIFMGTASTIKRLLPSFKNNPPQPGYLSESNRFGFIDELFKLLTRDPNNNANEVSELMASMNEILEHQERTVGSGVGTINIKMTARIFANSNFYRGCDTLEGMCKYISHSWLGRWIIYFQDDDHVNMIKNNSAPLERHPFPEFLDKFNSKDFLGILDFLHSVESQYNMVRVMEIYRDMLKFLTAQEMEIYKARYKHHIICIIDGIVKTRCLFERKVDFEAIEEDYIKLEAIWRKIILSWKGPNKYKYIDKNELIQKMPIYAKIIYDYIKEHELPQYGIKEYALKTMDLQDYRLHMIYLQEHDLIYTDPLNGVIKPYYTKNKELEVTYENF